MLIGWEGRIDELEGGVRRVRCPASPNFYYGNFLLFPDAPRPEDVEGWPARFAAAFTDDPRIGHVCLRWDRPDGEAGAAAAFAAAGYTIDMHVVMTARETRAPRTPNTAVRLARVESDAEWDAVRALQIEVMTAEWGPGSVDFARDQVARYRRFVDAGHGAWFAAWDGEKLAADLGVFADAGVGRFQAVETAATHRRRGICATLVHYAAQWARAELGVETLVMVAVPGEPAASVYEGVGFNPTERLVAVLRRERRG